VDEAELAELRRRAHGWLWVHRVRTARAEADGEVVLDAKCPDRDCRNWEQIPREVDADGVALVGYPGLTGQTGGCEPHGYPDGGPEADPADAGDD
jgi:hypothetical protein